MREDRTAAKDRARDRVLRLPVPVRSGPVRRERHERAVCPEGRPLHGVAPRRAAPVAAAVVLPERKERTSRPRREALSPGPRISSQHFFPAVGAAADVVLVGS
jgi:hypothetical protein